MVLAFGNHRLDIARRELRRGCTELVGLEPKAFDLLAFLIRNRERVVSKDDLLQAIWSGRIVSESGDSDADQRAALLLAAQDLPSDFPDPYRRLIACYTHMGRLDEAREVLQRLRAMTPLQVPLETSRICAPLSTAIFCCRASVRPSVGQDGEVFISSTPAVGVPMDSTGASAAIASRDTSNHDLAGLRQAAVKRKAKLKRQAAPAKGESGHTGAVGRS